MQQRHHPPRSNENDLPIEDDFISLPMLYREVGKIAANQSMLIREFDELQDIIHEDHEELTRLLMTRDFFWKIVIKTGLPLMFLMFGIGWGVGKFAQHISTALGW
jgi:hypothetical protein